MNPALYVETSVVGYLTSRPSRHVVTAARQQLTREWWDSRRADYDLFISRFVVEEVASGDADAAAERVEALRGLRVLGLTPEAEALARALREEVPLPEKAAVDALHIAVAAANGAVYLLTWNFRHIANAVLRNRIEEVCRSRGYEPPVICTPEELLGR